MSETIRTGVTDLFGIKVPIVLAGMNVAAGPELAAAVTNNGGLGVIGGVGYAPEMLRTAIKELKEGLHDKNAPFGVDLLLPQVGGSARKTNKDYTGGQLPELIDIIISEKASVFVSAVGVPPRFAVDKLHAAGIPVMNMIGSPKHVAKALDAGVDLICAQGGEGGGHTGDVATSILIPKVVDLCKGRVSPLTGGPILVIAAGGIYDGRGLAMALSLGADAVWVGTRFVASSEAGAPKRHKEGVVTAGVHDTVRSLIYTGRPMRVKKSNYIMDWENNRQDEMQKCLKNGILPYAAEVARLEEEGTQLSTLDVLERMPMLMGQVAGVIDEVKSAKEIMDDMVGGAIATMRSVIPLVVPRDTYTPGKAPPGPYTVAKSRL